MAKYVQTESKWVHTAHDVTRWEPCDRCASRTWMPRLTYLAAHDVWACPICVAGGE